ncbi:hypothetical protein E2C01_052610 [Portunus trituberculatus]|uniref:Uncharacterized protein n=1 Tax=Portunus trituberculatus TaxID=210409 RepID=A0A5B7GM79_PORTR|nr:hypothetical protein [Portunus trituberculatus]
MPGTCRKLNVKWDGPYRVCDIISEQSLYVVENVFTGKRTRRAAGQGCVPLEVSTLPPPLPSKLLSSSSLKSSQKTLCWTLQSSS